MSQNKTRILFQDTSDHHVAYCDSNLGSAAVVQCTAQMLRKFISEVEIASLIQLSPDFAARNSIRVVPAKIFSSRSFSLGESTRAGTAFLTAKLWSLICKYLQLNIDYLVKRGLLKEYYDADIIIDLSMDHLNDNFGIIPVLEHTRDILLAWIFNKPVVIYAQSIGPYNGRFAVRIARMGLDKATLITVREGISREWLEKIGVHRPPIRVTADPAFLLESAKPKRIDELLSAFKIDNSNPVIGIAVLEGILLRTKGWSGNKRFIWSAYQFLRYLLPEKLFLSIMKLAGNSKYFLNLRSSTRDNAIAAFAKVADYLSIQLNATILLLPHVIMPEETAEDRRDARNTANEVYEIVSNKEKILPFSNRYTAEDIKGIIGRCDMVISAKMHAAIAATSQCIPTLVIGAHPKFKGIMRTLDMEEWVCERFSTESIIEQAQKLWQQRKQVKARLNNKIKSIKEQALLNGKLASELVNLTQKTT